MSMFRNKLIIILAALILLGAGISGFAKTSFASNAPSLSQASHMEMNGHSNHHSFQHEAQADLQVTILDAQNGHCSSNALGTCCPILSLPVFKGIASIGNPFAYVPAPATLAYRVDLSNLQRPPQA